MQETWKDIKGFEGVIKISDLGTVVTYPRVILRPIHKGKLLNLNINYKGKKLSVVKSNGYPSVKTSINGIIFKQYLHRLLALSFIPNTENKPHINHINGIRTDYRLENLEWVTHKENMIHASKTGLLQVSKKHLFKQGK